MSSLAVASAVLRNEEKEEQKDDDGGNISKDVESRDLSSLPPLDPGLLDLAGLLEAEAKSEWMNAFVANLWPYIRSFIDKTLHEEVQPLIQDVAPLPLKSLYFTSRDVGKLPPQVKRVSVRRVHPLQPFKHQPSNGNAVNGATNNNATQHPSSAATVITSETERVAQQALGESANDVFGENGAGGPPSLEVKLELDFESPTEVGLKLGVLPLEVGVHRVSCEGPICLIFAPLTSTPPFFGGVQIYFPNLPDIALKFSGPARIGDVPFIQRLVRKSILRALTDAMVFPNRLAFSAEPAVDVVSLQHPPGRGVLRLTVIKATGLQSREGDWSRPTSLLKNEIADAFVEVTLGAQVWHTSTIVNSNCPHWSESENFIVHDSTQQVLTLKVLDEEYLGQRSLLGSVRLPLRDLLMTAAAAARSGSQVKAGGTEEAFSDTQPSTSPAQQDVPKSAERQKKKNKATYKTLLAQSAGGGQGPCGIIIDGERLDIEGKGMRVVCLNSATGDVVASRTFNMSCEDGNDGNAEAEKFENFALNEIPPSSVVIIVGSEDCSKWQRAKKSLLALGSISVAKRNGCKPSEHESYILLGYKSERGLNMEDATALLRQEDAAATEHGSEVGVDVVEDDAECCGRLYRRKTPLPSWVRERVGPVDTCLRLSLTLAFKPEQQRLPPVHDGAPKREGDNDELQSPQLAEPSDDDDETDDFGKVLEQNGPPKNTPVMFRLPIIPPPEAPTDEIEAKTEKPDCKGDDADAAAKDDGGDEKLKSSLEKEVISAEPAVRAPSAAGEVDGPSRPDGQMELFLRVETFRLLPMIPFTSTTPSIATSSGVSASASPLSSSSSSAPSALLWLGIATAHQIVAEEEGAFKVVVSLIDRNRNVIAREETAEWRPPSQTSMHCEKSKDPVTKRKVELLKDKNCSCEEIAAVLDLPEDEIAALLGEVTQTHTRQCPRPVWNQALTFFVHDIQTSTVRIQIRQNRRIVIAEAYWPLSAILQLQVPSKSSEGEIDPGYEKLSLHPAGSLTVKGRLFSLRPSI